MALDPVHIHIKNFQSVEDVKIDVAGFTCVVGRSNIGKSAIMRAVSSAILNDPVVGKVRKGATFCSVNLKSSGWEFTWEKGDRGVNRYTIGGKVYDKIGQKQLDEVINMGFGSIRIGDQEIQPWWSSQFFPLFLLDKSGPQVTDFISEVSRLTVLQDAIVLSARGKKHSLDEAKVKLEEVTRLKARTSKVAGLDSLIQLQTDLEAQAQSIRTYEAKLKLGESLQSKLEDLDRKIKSLSKVSSVSLPENNIQILVETLASKHKFWITLESHAKKILGIRDIVKVKVTDLPTSEFDSFESVSKFSGIPKLQKSVQVLKPIESVSIPQVDEVGSVIAGISHRVTLQKKLTDLKAGIQKLSSDVKMPADISEVENDCQAIRLLSQVSSEQKEIVALIVALSDAEEELANVTTQISLIPSCPTCSRPVAESHSHSVST